MPSSAQAALLLSLLLHPFPSIREPCLDHTVYHPSHSLMGIFFPLHTSEKIPTQNKCSDPLPVLLHPEKHMTPQNSVCMFRLMGPINLTSQELLHMCFVGPLSALLGNHSNLSCPLQASHPVPNTYISADTSLGFFTATLKL